MPQSFITPVPADLDRPVLFMYTDNIRLKWKQNDIAGM